MRSMSKLLFRYPSMARMSLVLILLPILLMFGGLSIQGQTNFGRISGTITDQNGAVVPHAKVTITNNATKLARTAVTNSEGFFVADDLPAALIVTAEQEGFKTVLKTENEWLQAATLQLI